MHNNTKTNPELPQTMGSTLNNKSTTTEPQHKNDQQPKPPGRAEAKMHFTGAKSSVLSLLLLLLLS